MTFCPECGVDHHVADRIAEQAADREVTLAKINADRDIKIAQITARTATELAETDNALDVARAEGQVEGMETVIESAPGDQAAEPVDGAPIIVEAPDAEPEPEPEPELAPPVAESTAPSSPSSQGWWSGYR